MKIKYYKEQSNGITIWFNGILKIDGKQIINPTKEMIESEGWIQYIEPKLPEPSESERLSRTMSEKLEKLYKYDKSQHVNDCVIMKNGNELHYWADKTERDSLKGAVKDLLSVGRTEYRLDLREFRMSLQLPCEQLLQMLAQLEVYAIDCYNKTTDHEYAIKTLTTIEEIEQYDFTTGYPNKLIFNL